MRKPSQSVRYHPFFFLLMALVAMAELGLTSFLINAGNENDSWPSSRYHKLYASNLFPSPSLIETTQIDILLLQRSMDDVVRYILRFVGDRRLRTSSRGYR